MSLASMLSFSFVLPMISEKKNFEYFYQKFTPNVALATNQIKWFGQKSYETLRTTQYTFL